MTRLLACADCDRREFGDDSAHAARAPIIIYRRGYAAHLRALWMSSAPGDEQQEYCERQNRENPPSFVEIARRCRPAEYRDEEN